MTRQYRNSRNNRIAPSMRLLFSVAAIGVSFCAVGCFLVASPERVRSVKGTWSGVLEPVQVFDDRGTSYDAAALAVTGGPMQIFQAGSAPNRLALVTDEQARILDPGKLPVGKSVRISGTWIPFDHAQSDGRTTHVDGVPVYLHTPINKSTAEPIIRAHSPPQISGD